MRSALLEQNSGKFWQERPTVISNEFAVTGSAADGVLGYVSVPKGAYVTKVQLMATVAVGTQDLDVGDGVDDIRYMEAITTITQYNIITAPNVASGTTGTNQVAGRYYAAADTIDVTSDITSATAVGSCILSVWYYVL